MEFSSLFRDCFDRINLSGYLICSLPFCLVLGLVLKSIVDDILRLIGGIEFNEHRFRSWDDRYADDMEMF